MGPYAALLTIELHFPEAGDLKAKRRELSSLKAQLHGRLGCAVSEVDHQDLWQRATLAVALTGGDLGVLDRAVDGVGRFLDARYPQGARLERILVSYDDVRGIG